MRIIYIHPIFNVYGGAEKVILDMLSWTRERYSSLLFTLFDCQMIKGLNGVFSVCKDIPFSSCFGYKANPFVNKCIKKLGKAVAERCSSDDIFILSNFPATAIFYEALKKNKELEKAKVYFLCFEPDRILYNKESEKFGFIPKQLNSLKFRFASFLIRNWKNKDKEIVKKCVKEIISISWFALEQAKKIYPGKKTEKIFEHYTPMLNKGNKKISIKNLNKAFDIDVRDSELVFLSLGRIEEGKGVIELIEIFKELCKDYENLRLIIGGKGSLRKEVANLTKNEEKINYLGFVPDKNIKDLFGASDIFVFLGQKETGGPLTIIEAMGNHLSVLVPDDGGAAYEIIKDRVNGFITSNDKKAIKNKIIRIIEMKNSNKLEKIKDNAYEWVKKYATKKKAKEDFFSFLRRISY